MAGEKFQFKQFTVWQDACAMKVCTDSCILGAYDYDHGSPATILDIGSGTGLLSLMLAQRYPSAAIDAVEVNARAVAQSMSNVAVSEFSNRITIHHTSIQKFASCEGVYDLIVSNPPFYTNSLVTGNHEVNLARHNTSLPPVDLMEALVRLLNRQGGLAVIMLPPQEAAAFIQQCRQFGLYLLSQLQIKDRKESRVIRVILGLGFSEKQTLASELCIKENNGQYTQSFQTLLQPFYTIF